LHEPGHASQHSSLFQRGNNAQRRNKPPPDWHPSVEASAIVTSVNTRNFLMFKISFPVGLSSGGAFDQENLQHARQDANRFVDFPPHCVLFARRTAPKKLHFPIRLWAG
jgi:hypothetical protein